MAKTAWTRYLKKHMAREMKHHGHIESVRILAKKYHKTSAYKSAHKKRRK